MDIVTEFIENNWISIIGAVIGLVFLYLEYKANVWMWLASIVMAVFYIYIFYHTGLYASMGIYIYFFLASVYGWFAWITQNRKEQSGQEIITRMPVRYIVPIVIGVIVIGVVIFFILSSFSENPIGVTLGDAVTTSLNIVALWMISRKWVEQWLLVIPANALSGILLFVQHDVMSGILFVIFFIVSIFGYYNWRSMVLSDSNS